MCVIVVYMVVWMFFDVFGLVSVDVMVMSSAFEVM